MARTISNSNDTIDSRDVIARIEELQGERDAHDEAHDHGEQTRTWAEEFPMEVEELAALEALAEEGEDYSPDWKYGATLVRDSYFQEYAQELAEEIGAIQAGASWPNTCIDWEQAARELQQDYTSVEFGGVDYWVR